MKSYLFAAAATLAIFSSINSVRADEDDEFEDGDDDVQTEFYLPYSETEDVDFSITRPGSGACYQWSTNNTEVINLLPIVTDFNRACGTKLDFQIIPKACPEGCDILIAAENVDLDGYDDSSAVAEYVVHVRSLAKTEVLGLKTKLKAGGEVAPFGIAGYDADEIEFDTLDGLQISWYIGANQEIAQFERYRSNGPIARLEPMAAGKGAVIAVLDDKNYEHIPPAYLEFEISAPLAIHPDGVYLLEGGTVHFKLTSEGVKDGNKIVKDVAVGGEGSSYTFEIEHPEIATIDAASNNVTALLDGETNIVLKSTAGDVVKKVPIRVTTAHSMAVKSYPHPETNQLMLGNTYDIKVDIMDKNGNKIHPSENILCKTSFPKQMEILDITENGLEATVRTIQTGYGRVKASLRSVLTDDDEEIEVVPHVKAKTDFEIYETIVIKPKETILPWDENVAPTFNLNYEATGGGKVYQWSVSDEEMASINNEGRATTLKGPGSFTVRAAMAKDEMDNYDEAKVYISPVTHLEIKQSAKELSVDSPITLALVMKTFIDDREDPVMFTDCSDIPFKINLSDEEHFVVDHINTRGNNRVYDSCSSFTIRAKTPGKVCTVTVSYEEPSTGRELKTQTVIASYRQMRVVYPEQVKNGLTSIAQLLLPVGSSHKVVMQGGVNPWMSKPVAHFKQVEVDDTDVIAVKRIPESEISAPKVSDTSKYADVHAFIVTCKEVGKSGFVLSVGNTASEDHRIPLTNNLEVDVRCEVPTAVKVNLDMRKLTQDALYKLPADTATGRIMVPNHRDILAYLTVKNKNGENFNAFDSLKFNTEITDANGLVETFPGAVQFGSQPLAEGKYGKIDVAGKGHISLSPSPSFTGPVDVSISLVGYKEELLKEVGNENVPAMPKPEIPEGFTEDDFDEEDLAELDPLSVTLELMVEKEHKVTEAVRRAQSP